MSCLAEDSLCGSNEGEAVSWALSRYEAGDIVSTAVILQDIKQRLHDTILSDEDLIALVLQNISGRSLGVSFDHRQA